MAVTFEVLGRRLVSDVHRLERHVEEERTASVVALDQAYRLVGQQEGPVTVLDDRAAVAVPVERAVLAQMGEGVEL